MLYTIGCKSGRQCAVLHEAYLDSNASICGQAHAILGAEGRSWACALLQGFKQQTAKWPLQPIQAAAAYLAKHSRKAVVADFGCGDAELARMAPQETVHSLDLVSSAPGVIACNMADTPLGTCPYDSHCGQSFLQPCTRYASSVTARACSETVSKFQPLSAADELDMSRPILGSSNEWLVHGDGLFKSSVCCADTASVDVAVFCLALMGTDYPSFLQEAARVLKPHGTIWIAEVHTGALDPQM